MDDSRQYYLRREEERSDTIADLVRRVFDGKHQPDIEDMEQYHFERAKIEVAQWYDDAEELDFKKDWENRRILIAALENKKAIFEVWDKLAKFEQSTSNSFGAGAKRTHDLLDILVKSVARAVLILICVNAALVAGAVWYLDVPI